jgi:pimeloyl-ACP methyl ester carboxylesterase
MVLAGAIAGCRSLGHGDAPQAVVLRPARLTTPLPPADVQAGPVDRQFAAVRQAWYAASSQSAADWSHYNDLLRDLLATASESGSLDPARGLVIRDGDRIVTIPVVHHGFPWAAEDFQRLYPPPSRHEPLLTRWYACGGIGVPLVVARCRRDESPIEARFYPEKSAFSATALLRFDDQGAATLEFQNPLARPRAEVADGSVPIAGDLTASLAWALAQTPRTYLVGLMDPGQPETAPRLTFLEPYQPGKIPVVIIHGLYSDPQSGSDLINDLRASPGFAEAHQVWTYRYPTGQGILQSAATLRDELAAAVAALDPEGGDRELRQMVLIGHSMGGLLAKLQVTHSEDRLWRTLANRPLEEIVTTEETRAELARLTFFDPSPHVARVIFMATPHKGALPSSDLVGKSAARLVEPPAEQAAMHAQLIADNPGTFHPAFERRFPTSIDMLAPRSPLLAVMRQMRVSDCVSLHNIVGVSHAISMGGPSDGVVSVRSALHPGCQSVLAVGEPHGEVHRSLETSQEVVRILKGSGAAPAEVAGP